ncbi:hypothetical protein [Acidiphilium sp. C61]|uniref:hypothetical protein n=1 Tax=Acidiphilium sp. C61 TaxID=1671485 RepID=UPI001F37B587|nr:hypothetical protein [Acidiphilium sp. C61]
MLTFRAGAASTSSGAAGKMADHLMTMTLPGFEQDMAAYYQRGMTVDGGLWQPGTAAAEDNAAATALDAARPGTIPEPRRDMHPTVAAALGIDTSRPLTRDEIAELLAGNRADGEKIAGKQYQRAVTPLAEVFGLDPMRLPTRAELENLLAGKRADGFDLPAAPVEAAPRSLRRPQRQRLLSRTRRRIATPPLRPKRRRLASWEGRPMVRRPGQMILPRPRWRRWSGMIGMRRWRLTGRPILRGAVNRRCRRVARRPRSGQRSHGRSMLRRRLMPLVCPTGPAAAGCGCKRPGAEGKAGQSRSTPPLANGPTLPPAKAGGSRAWCAGWASKPRRSSWTRGGEGGARGRGAAQCFPQEHRRETLG